MIYLLPRKYKIHRENGIYIVRGTEKLPCPHCGGKLRVHGSCKRKLREIDCTRTFRLRVMKCTNCGKTHRELPSFFVPYKRYSLNSICEILCSEKGLHPCDTSTRCRFFAHFFFLWPKMWVGKGAAICKAMTSALGNIKRLRRVISKIIYLSIWKWSHTAP